MAAILYVFEWDGLESTARERMWRQSESGEESLPTPGPCTQAQSPGRCEWDGGSYCPI